MDICGEQTGTLLVLILMKRMYRFRTKEKE